MAGFTESLLLDGSGSGSVAETEPELASVAPPDDGSTVPSIVTVAVPAAAREPRRQVTVPAEIEHEPWLADATGERSWDGRGSVTVTFVASLDPPLITVRVNVTAPPATGLGGETDFTMLRSDDEVTPTVSDASLFPGVPSAPPLTAPVFVTLLPAPCVTSTLTVMSG
jgi:hypothetical protein